IVGGTVPIAVGAGLAAKMDGCGGLAVTYFGDGTIEEGVVQESLNLASALDLPVLFVCENNLYSSHLDIRYRQPSDRIARFADAHHIPAHSVDGNNLLAVSNAARELIERARTGGGPGFLEAVTYRWCGHVGPDENVDVGLRRKREDLDAWKGRDPIRRLAEGLAACGVVRQEEFERMGQEVRERVLKARDQALDAPYPEPDALLGLVYREGYPLKIP
ncbi:MAG: thiamine pyrophosphate-dependent dehydrogenase E1 component subunit alpha, partial [Nitrospinaceae bacterium]